MNPLLAHHVELEHLPVLVILWSAGLWIGWQLVTYWLRSSGRDTGRPERAE
jgi:hypothetical protein